MKITALKCAVLGNNPIVRITTDEGISGYGEVEQSKPYLHWHVLYYEPLIVGEDPTNVERVMQKIRHLGAFKPWGSAVSAIEMALWDIAGKAAGIPVYKLLGGKVRDRVRVYNGAVRFPMDGHSPEDYANNMTRMRNSPEGFTIIKQGLAFHGRTAQEVPGFSYGEVAAKRGPGSYDRGLLTERGLKYLIACVEAMKGALGDEVGLALDCGPGWTPTDAVRFARPSSRSTCCGWRTSSPAITRRMSTPMCTVKLPGPPQLLFTPVRRFTSGKTSRRSSRRTLLMWLAPTRATWAASPSSNGWPSTQTCTGC